MSPPRSSRDLRPWLATLAILYAAATLLYGALWFVAVQNPGAAVELGIDAQYEPATHALRVDSVVAVAPAGRAGLRSGDRIVAFDGERLADRSTQVRVWAAHQPGDSIRLTILRPGEPATRALAVAFRPARAGTSASERIAVGVLNLFPLPFIGVGLTVLFLRIESSIVWDVALLFGGFAAVAGPPGGFALLPAELRGFAAVYRQFMVSLAGPLFYAFFALFPTRSPLDRRAPWIRWAAIAFGLAMAVAGLPREQLELPPPLPALLGPRIAEDAPFWFVFAFILLGLASLLWNRLAIRDLQMQRRIRVILWGTLAGVGPALALAAATRVSDLQPPRWLDALVNVVVLSIFPLSFAYAILKHRVLDIPALLQVSARYLLVQRGFSVLLSAASVGLTVLFSLGFSRTLRFAGDAQQPIGIALGAAFGGTLLWGGMRVQRRVGRRIDRAFFRSAYDARQVLEDLAERTARATDRTELARLLDAELREALRPVAMFVYLRGREGSLAAMGGPAPPELPEIAADEPALLDLARRGQCWEAARAGPEDPIARSPLARLQPECLVPVTGRDARPIGLLVLGSRLSEEPYSGEDRRLLLSVAGQSGVALENIRLAEEIAGRMEAEKRVAREIGIAREVQGRLLPQAVPELQSLELSAHCIQARSVGGDYYDFLDLGPDRIGFVLADVSGKGIHAALLMANLQAHLRSQSGSTPQDPLRVMRQVNQMMWKSTDEGRFATLFYGIYADAARRLTFINCGHNPPLCVRADGRVERLCATATVLGAFESWDCALEKVQLAPGDVLVVYSDGITEAARGAEQYGEERLAGVVRGNAGAGAEAIAAAILEDVQAFGAGEQSDDLTLLVGRVR
jgi:sigma-B regulation protein RsbU (phosphoserine phosphatase)